jgi:hypothetical protein
VKSASQVCLRWRDGSNIEVHRFIPHLVSIVGACDHISVLSIACATGQIVLAFALRTLLTWRNKKRDVIELPLPDLDAIMEDLTDFEKPHFRYSY